MPKPRTGGNQELLSLEPPRYDTQANVRVDYRWLRMLEVVAAFERVKQSDLLRGWVTAKFHEYEKNKRFMRWLERQDERTRNVWQGLVVTAK